MSPRARTRLAQVGSFVLAGILLYLALRGTDFDEIGQALRAADYRWLLPLVAVVLLSHFLRAWRWRLLLDALPSATPEAARARISLKTAFYSVMIGYMVNYAAPRLGEVARTANLSRQERLPFSSVLGTVVVERILDVLLLALALATVPLLMLDRSATLDRLFFAPLREMLGRVPLLAVAGLTIGVSVLVVLIYRGLIRRQSEAQRTFFGRFRPIFASFRDGMYTVLRSKDRLALIASTVAIWACYAVMAHIPFELLRIAGPYDLSLADSWCIMVLGALGIVVPSPGGTGSYHLVTILTLVNLFSVGEVEATTYAVLTHGAQLVLYVAVGFLCILLQGTGFSGLNAAPPESGQASSAAPKTASERA